MSSQTVSEALFERHCVIRRVPYRRIEETGAKVADYQVRLNRVLGYVEVKQIDANERDKSRELIKNCQDQGMGLAPVARVRGMIASGYKQLKSYAQAGNPCILVTYNNAGLINYIDEFTATKAMFGSPCIYLAPDKSGIIRIAGQGFGGGRRITRNTCRGLSALCVLETGGPRETHMLAYHNPYAANPIDPMDFRLFADYQYTFNDPHGSRWADLSPTLLEV